MYMLHIIKVLLLLTLPVLSYSQTVRLKIVPEGTRKVILDSTGADLPMYFDGNSFYITQATYNTYAARLQRHAARRNFILRDTTVNTDANNKPNFK